MNILNVICQLDPLFTFSDASDKGWEVINRCRGQNNLGILAIVKKGEQIAGIKENGLQMELVEVIL